MSALAKLYEKPSASNMVFLMKHLSNMKMSKGGSVADHLNDFNTITIQLSFVGVTFDDEVRALLFLCSLPESWNGLVMSISNFVFGSSTLKFDDVVGAILSEEMQWKSSGETSGASFHATPARKHFYDYVQGYFGQVRLGDDKPCKIVGMGIVFIKQQNGNQWLLKEERHVPNLKKNLISIGQLGGEDMTLWHHRLRRMSEKGMKILHSRNLLPGKRLKCLRSDNGGEYCSKDFDRYFSENGIHREKTVPGTPQENGMSERMNRTIMERARGPSSSLDGGIPEEAWIGKEYTVLNKITEKVMVPENHNDQQPEQQPQQKKALQTPESGVRRSTRMSRPLERYSPSLYYVLLTNSGEPECYEEVVQVETRKKWE
eukprot:PITA_26322